MNDIVLIEKITIDNSILCVKPKTESFDMIYRAAMGVRWNNDGKYLYFNSPIEQESDILDYYGFILAAVLDEYGKKLQLNDDTVYENIDDNTKIKIEKYKVRATMNCKIIDKEAFYVLEKTSKHRMRDGENNVSVPAFWAQCHSDGTIDKLIRNASDKTLMFGICYGSGDNDAFDYSVAVLCDENTPIPDGLKKTFIPARTWAMFECVGAMPQAIQQAWREITTKLLPSSEYRPTGEFDMEVYPDGDMNCSDYKSEIWISVQKTATFDILDDTGLDERISNTAKLIADFARENLDKELADEIVSDLAGIIDNKED